LVDELPVVDVDGSNTLHDTCVISHITYLNIINHRLGSLFPGLY